ncbi:MAG TPA: hypothetical protein VMD97_06390 [Candidatus Aquilonibacter sp.]|nr:hypothetical protein [Candidatus Aquilonibacter sp.]
MRNPSDRAQPPRPPARTSEQQRREDARVKALRERVRLEQSSLLRGLILLAVVILLVSLARAGWDRLFVPGWWREW